MPKAKSKRTLMANPLNTLDKAFKRDKAPSICDKCNSKSYCANRAPGMSGCENFNKFPKPGHDDFHR